jgi:hypothetical protein
MDSCTHSFAIRNQQRRDYLDDLTFRFIQSADSGVQPVKAVVADFEFLCLVP